YSRRPLRISDRGAVASFLLPVGYVAVPFLVGFFGVGGRLRARDFVLLAGLWVTFVGRILLKDFRDVEGDAMFGKRTYLVRHGRPAPRQAVVLAALAAVYAGLYVTTLGQRDRVLAIRPY